MPGPQPCPELSSSHFKPFLRWEPQKQNHFLTRINFPSFSSRTSDVSFPSHFCTWTSLPPSSVTTDCREGLRPTVTLLPGVSGLWGGFIPRRRPWSPAGLGTSLRVPLRGCPPGTIPAWLGQCCSAQPGSCAGSRPRLTRCDPTVPPARSPCPPCPGPALPAPRPAPGPPGPLPSAARRLRRGPERRGRDRGSEPKLPCPAGPGEGFWRGWCSEPAPARRAAVCTAPLLTQPREPGPCQG